MKSRTKFSVEDSRSGKFRCEPLRLGNIFAVRHQHAQLTLNEMLQKSSDTKHTKELKIKIIDDLEFGKRTRADM
jgi:hypothetical protein